MLAVFLEWREFATGAAGFYEWQLGRFATASTVALPGAACCEEAFKSTRNYCERGGWFKARVLISMAWNCFRRSGKKLEKTNCHNRSFADNKKFFPTLACKGDQL